MSVNIGLRDNNCLYGRTNTNVLGLPNINGPCSKLQDETGETKSKYNRVKDHRAV